MNQKNANDTFNEIISLTERTTELMEAFGDFDATDRESILTDYFAKELSSLGENDELSVRLIRTAEMLIGVGTPKVAALLGRGLDHSNLDIRMLTGDVLMHLAEDGLESIMPAVDSVLKKGGIGAEEMPFILAELDDPEVPRVLERFLASDNADVVASTLEATVECGDTDSVAAIEKLTGDSREVAVEEGLGGSDKTTIGRLAKDALELLSDVE